MRVGVIYDLSNPEGWRRPFPLHYRRFLDHIQAVEEMGFDSVWLAENHFADDGLCPTVLTMAAAIAARTHRVRIGTSVMLLPLVHPIRAAEEAALVDNLSEGRLVLGLGRGYRREEFQAYGISRARKGPVFEEALRVLVGAFTSPGFSYQGEYFQVENVRLAPPPVQRPHPPIYIGARSNTAVRMAARLGYPLIGTGGHHHYAVYADALREAGRDPTDYPVVMLRAFLAAHDPERTRADMEPYLAYRRQAYQRRAASLPATIREPQEATLQPQREPFVGTPEACVAEARSFSDAMPLDTLVIPAIYPGQGHDQSLQHLELFTREVLPRLTHVGG